MKMDTNLNAMSETDIAERWGYSRTMELLTELRPVLKSVSVLGLYYNPCLSKSSQAVHGTDDQAGGDRKTSNPPQRPTQGGWTIRGSKYYCFVVCCLNWFQFLRCLPAFWTGIDHRENLLSIRIMTSVWYLQCTLNATIMYRGCTKPSQLQNFFKAIQEDGKRRLQCSPPEDKVGKLKRKMTVITIITWALLIMNVSVAILYMLELNETSAKYAAVFADPFGTSLPSKVFAVLLFATSSSAWLFPVLFSGGFCSFLILRFNTLNRNVHAAILKSGDAFPPDLELYRHQHTRLCAWVGKLDEQLKLLHVTAYATNLPLMCFLMYRLASFKVDVFELAVVIFWLVGCLSNVAILSVWAAFVHEEAHSPVDCLYEVNTAGATQEQLTQLQLFISRVTNTSIGFTAVGIFTVTKDMILTFAGALITYFVLLLQYNIN